MAVTYTYPSKPDEPQRYGTRFRNNASVPLFKGYTAPELRELLTESRNTQNGLDRLLGDEAYAAYIVGDLLDEVERLRKLVQEPKAK